MTGLRRSLLAGVVLALPALGVSADALGSEVRIELGEVTNMAATVSPHADELIVDAQGVLWRLPIEGGEAEPLTDYTLEPARPDWSPAGDAVVFQAYRGGTFDVWTMAPDGSHLRQLTKGPYDEREPTWSPDGRHIAFVSDRDGSYDVWSLEVASGELRQWTRTAEQEAYPAWSPDGAEIAYVVDNTAIRATDRAGATRTLGESPDSRLLSPSWSPSGDALKRARALDFDLLKTYVRLKPTWMARAAEAAHGLGLSVKSHFLSPGVLLGQDGTTHLGATERLDYSRIRSLTNESYEDVIKLFADADMSVITTFFFTEPSLFADGIVDDPRVRTLLPAWEREDLMQAAAFPIPLEGVGKRVATLAEVFRAGGVVLAGSDAPLDNVAVGLHSNLRWLGTSGLTPFEILQTATSLPARELGVDHDLGSVEPGKLADLAFVDGHPDRSIGDLLNVRMVMKNGQIFTMDELMDPYSGIAATE